MKKFIDGFQEKPIKIIKHCPFTWVRFS